MAGLSAKLVSKQRISEWFRKRSSMTQHIQQPQARLHILLHEDPVVQPVTPRRRSGSSNEAFEQRTSEWFRKRSSMTQQIQQSQARLPILHHEAFQRRISERFRERLLLMLQQIQHPQAGLHSLHHEVGQCVIPRRRSVSSSIEVFERRISEWFRKRSSMTQQIQQPQEGLHILHHEVEQPVTPSSSSSGNSDTRQQGLVEAGAGARAAAPLVADGSIEDPVRNPMKRSSSYGLLPPNLSELRDVQLGSSWSERSSVGNFILGETKFNTEEEPDCVTKRGCMNEK